MTIDTDKFKKKLEEEKITLAKELKGLGVLNTDTGNWETTPNMEEIKNFEADENDLADRSEDFQERTSTLNTLGARMNEVEAALSRIEENTYGKCEVCGKDIEEERLKANPAAATCTEHMN
jgi:RNA polymerase-binding transcription factor DksA